MQRIEGEGYDFIKTTYDTSLDSQISLLPLGFSPAVASSLFPLFTCRINLHLTGTLSFISLVSGFIFSKQELGKETDAGAKNRFLIIFANNNRLTNESLGIDRFLEENESIKLLETAATKEKTTHGGC